MVALVKADIFWCIQAGFVRLVEDLLSPIASNYKLLRWTPSVLTGMTGLEMLSVCVSANCAIFL